MSIDYITYKPTKSGLRYNDVRYEISNKWQEKAMKLQERRWRKLRSNEKRSSNFY